MRIERLAYLIQTANAGSISKSAEHLYISQQGLGQALRQLENELGVTLLNRSPNGIELSPAGEVTVKRAKEIMAIYEQLLEELKPYRNNTGTYNSLDIFTTPMLAKTILPKVFNLLSKKYPYINLSVTDHMPLEIIEKIKNRENGIALFHIQPDILDPPEEFIKNNIYFEPIMESELLACVSKTSPLANKKTVSIQELINYPLALINFELNIELVMGLFKGVGEPKIMLQSTNIDLCNKLIADGQAIGFTATPFEECLFEQYYRNNLIVTIPLENTVKLIIGYISSVDQSNNPIAKEFLRIARGVLAKLSTKQIQNPPPL